MQSSIDGLLLSASDLANHLGCRHLTRLNLLAARGEIAPPMWRDPKLETLQKRGIEHEEAYVRHLESLYGFEAVRVEDGLEPSSAVERTIALMRQGADIIVQASLAGAPWRGRADILIKIDNPSRLGGWSYEVIDTKLARETKAETILQLCLYAELIECIQGTLPERVGVVTPLSLDPEWYRTRDYLAYFRYVKRSLLAAVESDDPSIAEPCSRCEVCRWWSRCDRHWRDIDHLSLVAGVAQSHRRELQPRGIATVAQLAHLDPEFRPTRGSRRSYAKLREQARLQVESREAGHIRYELKTIEPGLGLASLPVPSPGDVFLDFEGDHFVGERGLEYLTGVAYRDGDAVEFEHKWALDANAEKDAFEWLVDWIEERRSRYPDLHVYHFTAYEPGTIKRLMGAFASRESIVDDWLRNHLFVDIHRVVRDGLVVGVERYSIKELEPCYGFKREIALDDARPARMELELAIEAGLADAVGDESLATVLGYNRDDCVSTLALRDWLESLRPEDAPRPVYEIEAVKEPTEHQQRIRELVECLTKGVSADVAERSGEDHAKWLLAHSLDYYRRELKVEYWEKFRLQEMPYEDYLEEKQALAELVFVDEQMEGKTPYQRYRFPAQECEIREGDANDEQGRRLGEVVKVDLEEQTVVIKKTQKARDWHPQGIYAAVRTIGTFALTLSLMKLAEHVVEHGMLGDGPFRAQCDLLLKHRPRLRDCSFKAGEDPDRLIDDVKSACRDLDRSVLPIQGPPGTGKTYLASRIILDLVSNGKKVGVCSNSHMVIQHLLEGTANAAAEAGVHLTIGHKDDEDEETSGTIEFFAKPEEALAGLAELDVLGGTKYLWAREEFADSVDVLVVDEASQLALADILAAAQCAESVILIGDPQQLERPQKGSHPPGVDVSALDHLLDGLQTMPSDRGFFLDVTRRLHPAICGFTSELFYESRLHALAKCSVQRLSNAGALDGAGLWLGSVNHTGNQSSSAEEVEAVKKIVCDLLAGAKWTDAEGGSRRLDASDVLIVAPYNAQVGALRDSLPGLRIGTVDKFQGQEAPVVIYSMTTSSPEDAPRGIDFLYSLNRLNVATSRAKCAVVMVASPSLFDVDCRTPKQMRLVNAMCRYLEVGKTMRTS